MTTVTKLEIAKMIDHSLLHPTMTDQILKEGCELALKYNVASVCIKPYAVKMAKEQNVILNPNKISGGCGRLLCCLNYEYEQYREASRGVPKTGKKVNLPEGTGKVRSVDIFSRTVTIDMTDAKPLVIDIDELREKMK